MNTCFLVNIAKLFDSKTSGGICRSSLLNQKQCGMVSTTKGRSGHSTGYLHIISRNHSNTLLLINRKNEKLVQNKPLQQRLFDLILGFWHFFYILIANVSWTVAQTPINHIIFWKTEMKTFRSIYVNYFNTLGFLAEVSTKLQKMLFFGQFTDHNSGRKHGN